MLLRRILETKGYYKKDDFDKHEAKTIGLMANMCKYPNQVRTRDMFNVALP